MFSLSLFVKTRNVSFLKYSCHKVNFIINDSIKPIVFLDSTSFDSQEKFEANWNMLYPWGTDHNGSARMYSEQVKMKESGVLEITAEWLRGQVEGKSKFNPYLPIAFHSGAIHLKKCITVTKEFPRWEISGDFQVPTVNGSWPAFWITGAESWPPEVDILEFKGSTTCWQNTVTGKNWENTIWTTEQVKVKDAATIWHNYKLTLQRIDKKDTRVMMYIDNKLKSEEIKDFTNKPFWLIINMQMEGASGTMKKESVARNKNQVLRAKNIFVVTIPYKKS